MFCPKCEILINQDCEAEECKEQRRRNRTAVFDYMICLQLEEQFRDERNQEKWN